MLTSVDLSHAKDTSKLAIVSHVSPVFHPGDVGEKDGGTFASQRQFATRLISGNPSVMFHPHLEDPMQLVSG